MDNCCSNSNFSCIIDLRCEGKEKDSETKTTITLIARLREDGTIYQVRELLFEKAVLRKAAEDNLRYSTHD